MNSPDKHRSAFSYSRLLPDALLAKLSHEYGLSAQARCRFHAAGQHDNYLVVDGAREYIARVYRKRRGSDDQMVFELEALNCLWNHTAPVANPLTALSTGQLFISIAYPEGERAVALFNYAPGTPPGSAITPEQSQQLGRVVAGVHLQADRNFHPRHRQVLSLDYLLDASMAAVSGYLDNAQRAYLRRLQSDIRSKLPDIPLTPPFYGLCIGDVNPRNFHISPKGALTLFDFDQCGYGWRAFEVGKYFAAINNHPQSSQLVDAFLRGYDSVRVLLQHEILALPWLMMVADIWVMGLHAYNAEYLGAKFLDADFWARKIAVLEQRERETGALL